MAAGLLSLSPELHLQIIDHLVESVREDDQKKAISEKEYHKRPDEQEQSKEHLLSPELKILIELSTTCSYLRVLLGSQIYKKLYLTNTVRSSASVSAVAAGPFRHSVKELVFGGRAPSTAEGGFDDVSNMFPEQTRDILANLSTLFPGLDTLDIGFAFDIYDWQIPGFFPSETLNCKLDTQLGFCENRRAYHALIARVWAAVAQTDNTSRQIKCLKMRLFVPELATTYSVAAPHNFLSTIEKFEISVWGCIYECGYASAVGTTYVDALKKLDHVFAALTSCTDFTFQVSQYSLPGLKGKYYTPLALLPNQMPMLKRLTLHHCFASPELTAFLGGHISTLEEIMFKDCITSPVALADNSISWHELFQFMHNIKVLKKITVQSEDVGERMWQEIRKHKMELQSLIDARSCLHMVL